MQPPLEDAALAICYLEIAACNAHPLVEREGARERDDRLVCKALSKVEYAEVVVCARVRGIDPAGERSQNVNLTAVRGCRRAGSCRSAHGLLYAHRAKDGVECLRVGDEEEESVQALCWLLEKEFGLN